MRPSVRAEKYIRDASGWRKDVTDGSDNGTDGQTDGQTDRQTDRQSATQYAAPPREEGRIKSGNVAGDAVGGGKRVSSPIQLYGDSLNTIIK